MFEKINVTPAFKSSVSSAIRSGRISHALILEGSDDETRFSAAGEIAKALLCKGDTVPCNACTACIKCDKAIHPDVHILQKEEDSTTIKVDAVRSIRAMALVFPNEGSKSVFIIREAQYMNPQAQNALLKILEEPSQHVCFILTCPSKSAFLETVISRTTVYSLGQEKYVTVQAEKADVGKKFANELLSVFVSSNEFYFIQKTAALQKDKPLFKATLSSMIPIIRDALIIQSGGKSLISGYEDTAKRISAVLTQKKTVELLEGIQQLSDAVALSANHNLSITRLSALLYDIKSH